jgi:hypothetical protein
MSLKILMSLGRRIFIVCLVLLAAVSAFGYFFWYKPKFSRHPSPGSFSYTDHTLSARKEVLSRMKLKAAMAKDYVMYHGFSRTHCFLLDMREPSGRKRFFVYNLKKDSVELAGLVTHGSGSETDSDELQFSNESNSYSTSLGKYKIGKSYTGKFGLAYKLHGLDETNDNAFNRCVVLHGHSCVPNDQVYPGGICTSLGCPTVSPAFLTSLQGYLDHAKAPVLLWIYY